MALIQSLHFTALFFFSDASRLFASCLEPQSMLSLVNGNSDKLIPKHLSSLLYHFSLMDSYQREVVASSKDYSLLLDRVKEIYASSDASADDWRRHNLTHFGNILSALEGMGERDLANFLSVAAFPSTFEGEKHDKNMNDFLSHLIDAAERPQRPGFKPLSRLEERPTKKERVELVNNPVKVSKKKCIHSDGGRSDSFVILFCAAALPIAESPPLSSLLLPDIDI